ncbi:acyl carrier protein [Actinoplanes sp. NPDC048791]|uniref:acyl carrier protein n=1 Tax=Actinoplanes sp. NPDC048791 TaxID=3154623 RepID=UPI0033FC288C
MPTEAELYDQVVGILAKTVGLTTDEITKDKLLKDDLGIDSLSMLEILAVTEDEFKMRIPDEDAAELTDVRSVVAYLTARLATPESADVTSTPATSA